MNSAMTQGRKDVGIDLTGKNHFGHFQGRIISYAPPFDDSLRNAHLGREFAQLLAPTMYDAKTNPDLMHQSQLFSQRDQLIMILRNLARELHDKRLALEPLNVGQRLAQEIESQLIANFRGVSHGLEFGI